MQSVSQLFYEVLIPLIAAGLGLGRYNRLSLFLKVLFWTLILWMITLALSYSVILYQRQNHLELNNHPVHNFYLLIETVLLLWALKLKFPIVNQWIIWWGLVFFTCTWVYELLYQGIANYFSKADTVACFLLTLGVLAVVAVILREQHEWWRKPEFIALCGLAFYYACSVPYVSAFDYLLGNYPKLSSMLFFLINDAIANVRYGALAIAFFLCMKRAEIP